MFRNYIKDLIECFKSSKLLSACLIGLILLSMYCCAHPIITRFASNNRGTNNKQTEQKIVVRDLSCQELADSVVILYRKLEELTSRVEKTAQNYQSDSNLLIEKSNNMVSLWLVISTALVTIIIGLSVWNNWQHEKSYKESIEKVKQEIKETECKLKETERELKKTTQINKISSIMTCLHCLPDPLMSRDKEKRIEYVKSNLSMIYDEFVSYSQLVKSDSLPYQNQKYVQLVLSSIKVAIQKSQGVFSDVNSNLCFYTFIVKLNECILELQNALTQKELNDKLENVLKAFNDFKTVVLP